MRAVNLLPKDSGKARSAKKRETPKHLPLIVGGVLGALVLGFLGMQTMSASGAISSNQAELDSKAWAVFGQATYKFNDQLALTGGLRYTKDEKDGYAKGRGPWRGEVRGAVRCPGRVAAVEAPAQTGPVGGGVMVPR